MEIEACSTEDRMDGVTDCALQGWPSGTGCGPSRARSNCSSAEA